MSGPLGMRGKHEGGCVDRTATYAMQGALLGGMYGASEALFRMKPPVEVKPIDSDPAQISKLMRTKPQFGNMIFYEMAWKQSKAMALCGAVFGASKCIAEDIRKTEDPINGFIGGFTTGCVMALYSRSLSKMVGFGLGLGVAGALIEASGGSTVQMSEEEKKARHFSFMRFDSDKKKDE